MSNFLTKEDNGKNVVTADGQQFAAIKDVNEDEGHATVEQHDDADLTDKLSNLLGWDDDNESERKIRNEHIDRREDDKIYLRQD